MATKGKATRRKKGKLLTAKMMEGQVLAALHEVGGKAHYKTIDAQVKKNLEPFTLIEEFRKEVQDFYSTSFSSKCAAARRSLKKAGFLEGVGGKGGKGQWQLKVNAPPPPPIDPPDPRKKKGPVVNRVTNFAADAVQLLEDKSAPPDLVDAVKELWWFYRYLIVDSGQEGNQNLQVEAEAINFILSKEPEWRTTPPNNPGFDLYRTNRNGKQIAWCEVKGLSNDFRRVSLTPTEFEHAYKKGERYWLYVVEDVGGERPTLIRIQDPAGKAERFTYSDPPWRNLAEG